MTFPTNVQNMASCDVILSQWSAERSQKNRPRDFESAEPEQRDHFAKSWGGSNPNTLHLSKSSIIGIIALYFRNKEKSK